MRHRTEGERQDDPGVPVGERRDGDAGADCCRRETSGRQVAGPSLLVLGHEDFGPVLLRAAEGIVGPIPRAVALAVGYGENVKQTRNRLQDALAQVESPGGILILTDIFGATPTNTALEFLKPGRVAILAGVNLPVLLKAQAAREEMGLPELAAFLKEYGGRTFVVR